MHHPVADAIRDHKTWQSVKGLVLARVSAWIQRSAKTDIMGWLLIKIMLLVAFMDRKEARNIDKYKEEDLEKEIMDVWAEKYAQKFFAPFAVSKSPVTLGI